MNKEFGTITSLLVSNDDDSGFGLTIKTISPEQEISVKLNMDSLNTLIHHLQLIRDCEILKKEDLEDATNQ